IVDAVTAREVGAGRGADLAPAAQHLGGQLEGDLLARPAEQVDPDHGRTAHGVDVGERVGGGDPAPLIGVVDHRGEEVSGRDDRPIVGDPYGGRVVAVVEADEQVAAGQTAGEAGEDGLELAGRDLAGAAAAGGELGPTETLVDGHAPRVR